MDLNSSFECIILSCHNLVRKEINKQRLYKNKAIYMPTVVKANHEIIRQYRRTVLIYFDWLMELKPTMHMIGCDWLMGCDRKCVTHRLTD